MVLSSLEPASKPETPAKAGPDLSETAKKVHAELARLGCYHGAADGSWGSDSRRAVEQFNKHAGQKLDTKLASLDTLDVLSAKPTRVCPLQCKSGYHAESEACVKIVCKAGFVVGDDNECEREHERAHERKPRTKSASRSDSSGSKKSSPKRDSNATSNMMMMRSRAWQH
jgi:putative peptidoglycan binding protein